MTKTLEVKPLKVLVGIPSNGLWNEKFGICMLNMFGYFMHKPVLGYTSQIIIPNSMRGSILPRSRYKLVQAALAAQCTHLLFVDTDQTFPRDTLHRLLAHRVGVVAANIATKQMPARPTARHSIIAPCYTDPDSHGLEKVWRVGTGLMLIEMDVFRRAGSRIFEVTHRPELDDYQGEDWTMCEAFERAGETLWVDHDLSKEVGHIGDIEYTHALVGEVVHERKAS